MALGNRARSVAGIIGVLAVVAAGVVGMPMAASADETLVPADEAMVRTTALPDTVSADALPTVQIDEGVVWTQVVVGDIVYAGGQFSNVRPAGASKGTQLVPRSNMVAYNIKTGKLVESFKPSFNNRVSDIAASPDGTKLFVVGTFTSVDDQPRSRIAVFDLPSGELSTTLVPRINGTAQSVAATNDTLYLGGYFSSVNGTSRARVAAVNIHNNRILPFRPIVDDGMVQSLAVSPDGNEVILSGSFGSVEGSAESGFGLARVDAVTGAKMSLPVNAEVRNAGTAAGIMNVTSDGTNFYGVGWHYGGTGNLEGTFAASWDDGELVWLEDCHGDTYDVAAVGDVVYTASHKHYCGNSGGFPQTEPWTFKHSNAWTKTVEGVNTRDIYGYPDHPGTPRPELLNWYPQTDVGTFTGKGQAVWSVSGSASGDYVVYGGEFGKVNGAVQQGLVRYAVRSLAPNSQGPRPLVSTDIWTPSAMSVASGNVRIGYSTVWDRDDTALTYRVYQDTENAAGLVDERLIDTTFWEPRQQKISQTGLVPGSSVRYRVTATDPSGNVLKSPWVTVTVSDAHVSPYVGTVLDDEPNNYWRFSEQSGSAVFDWAGDSDLTIDGSVTRGSVGAILDDPDTATTFQGASSASATSATAPDTYSAEVWFKTTTKRGGKLLGYGNARTGNSGNYDRHLYMENSGRLTFGVYPGSARTITSADAYNDGQWHQAVVSLGATGMQLYVDGKLVAQRSDTVHGQAYNGVWRVGGDNLSGWPNQPASTSFDGVIDEVSIYPLNLSLDQVREHYRSSGRALSVPPVPGDAYGKLVHGTDPSLYWRFDEASGAALNDAGRFGQDGQLAGDYARGATGAVPGGGSAVSFRSTTCQWWQMGCTATNGGNGYTTISAPSPRSFSAETWFKTNSARGGKLMTFASTPTGTSGSFDRQVYMTDSGKLVFTTQSNQQNLITSAGSYNDNAWHHVVATQGESGMTLYVDGVAVGTNPASSTQVFDGYWRVGGGGPGGSSSANLIGMFDEAAVYPRALTAAEVSAHFIVGTGSPLPNAAPVASFTSEVSYLELSADGSDSTDTDGTIVSYDWQFGDGGTASGVTASHTFAEAGTYSVQLTVTDDDGATHTATTDVTVEAPPVNVPPTAVISHTAADLSVDVDAGGSVDSDGTIASYSWTFGDGGTASGVTASHTYAEAGTYTVSVTVTDDKGATGVASAEVTVTAPPPPPPGVLAADAFDRTVASGWGAADLGGAWTLRGGNARFGVADGAGKMTAPAGLSLYADLNEVSSSSTRVDAVFSVDQLVEGQYVSVVGRKVGSSNYLVRLRLQADGGVKLYLLQDSNAIGGAYTVPGLTIVPGEKYALAIEVSGVAPTALKAKVWQASQAEPGWQREGTNSFAALQAPGAAGVFTFLPSAAPGPVVVAFDSITVATPGAVPPAENAAPVAAFTSQRSGLSVDVDAGGSVDSDGTIASYSWTFGDGGTASGVTASHTYAEAGTYTVSVTVTDDKGATGVASAEVTVTAPPPPPPGVLAADAFDRTVASGWGAADLGGAWTLRGGNARFGVADGAGKMTAPAGLSLYADLNEVSSSSTRVDAVFSVDQLVEGQYVSVVGRKVGSSNYLVRLRLQADGGVKLYLLQDSNAIGGAYTVPGLTIVPGEKYALAIEVSGVAPTALKAKVWQASQAEPGWQREGTNSFAALQAPGAAGVFTFLPSAAPGPVVVAFDSITVATPGAQ